MARCDYIKKLFPPKHFKSVRDSIWHNLHDSKETEVEYTAGESVLGQELIRFFYEMFFSIRPALELY